MLIKVCATISAEKHVKALKWVFFRLWTFNGAFHLKLTHLFILIAGVKIESLRVEYLR